MDLKYIVQNNLPVMPLKNYCRSYCGISMGLWRRIKWNGEVSINGEKVRPTMATVSPEDKILIVLPEKSPIQPIYHPLDIRYEDEYLMIVNKPAGMLVHPTAGDYTGTLGNAILYYYKETNQHLDFHPVHRLDRNTTGLILIAKLPQLQHKLTQNMIIAGQRAAGNGNMSPEEKEFSLSTKKFFHRSYLAIIPGKLPKTEGIIDLPIDRHPESIIQRICPKDGSGQEAVTCYRTLRYSNGHSLVELNLKTGRTHQIRVHLSSLGHPIIGDDLYGGNNELIHRQALHAYHLIVENPLNDETISVYADMPEDMRKLLQM